VIVAVAASAAAAGDLRSDERALAAELSAADAVIRYCTTSICVREIHISNKHAFCIAA
jgi:hypothetical protein